MLLDHLVSVIHSIAPSRYLYTFNCVELSTDTEEVVELKATVAQLQEQLSAKDKSIEVSMSHILYVYIV